MGAPVRVARPCHGGECLTQAWRWGQVPAVLWAGLQSLGELTQAGVCAEKEEQIDEDLGPWESTGGVITEEQVLPRVAMP